MATSSIFTDFSPKTPDEASRLIAILEEQENLPPCTPKRHFVRAETDSDLEKIFGGERGSTI